MSNPKFMKCKNFGCENMTEAGWPCCDSGCGYEYKNDMWKLQSYQNGVTKWNEPLWGLKNWSLEKINYYANV